MKPVVLGTLEAGGKLLYVEERVPETATLERTTDFTVSLTIDGVPLELDLFKLRQLKRLLNEGEKQLMFRHDQATRARNLSLDL